MRVAHIIMAHKNPLQLMRLAKSLSHPMFDIYVHIDAKVPINQFQILQNIPNLFFINKRSYCNWGGFSLFKGIVDCLAQVLKTNINYDFINLISGQDYPIQSSQHIYDYLENKEGKIFISFDDSNQSEWWETARSRYQRYHLTDYNFKGRYFIQKLINKIAPIRQFPDSMELYGGNKSCWWTLNAESAEYLVKKLDSRTDLYKFLKFCWGTDEFVIPTILMNSHLKNQVVNDNLRYIDWSEGNPNPKILLSEDFNPIIQSGMLFARKFDIDVDVSILNMLDEKNIQNSF